MANAHRSRDGEACFVQCFEDCCALREKVSTSTEHSERCVKLHVGLLSSEKCTRASETTLRVRSRGVRGRVRPGGLDRHVHVARLLAETCARHSLCIASKVSYALCTVSKNVFYTRSRAIESANAFETVQ